MVVVGGLTRLTESGLSIVEWRPFTGVVPPLTEAAWQVLFDAYKQYPEFQRVNPDMTLAGFQGIFWLEFVHRLLGRLIGLAFLLPLLWFWIRGAIPRGYHARLVGLFVLGGLQGVLGWVMVQSGLVDRPDVSPIRLAAHLGLAVVIYAAMLWVALDLLRGPPALALAERIWTRRLGGLALALAGATLIAGALVAGYKAGLSFNTFPRMAGQWVPFGVLHLEPWWRNPFENIITIQFQHRVLALVTLLAVLAFAVAAWRAPVSSGTRWAVRLLPVMILAQVGLGIATLLLYVPTPLASAHQAGALALVTLLVVACHGLRTAPPA
ncbi:heme A synthase [Roseospira marina]|uniref:Heme A synthase n=2 Tax=Roseospira marina TaxID=140057 RepID=A0A5M6IDF9_9PROT|nr:heme A synthase [Roseospira marina]